MSSEAEHNPEAVSQLAHDGFKAIALSTAFACVAGAAAVRADNYRFHAYDEIGSMESARKLAVDLREFIAQFPLSPERFASFIASFREPAGLSAIEFEKRLWGTLQCLHDLDELDWDPAVSSDPEDARFSFSFHGRSFFVVGMHPASSRWTRRLAWPTLVFNAHAQFEQLRRAGRFEPLQRTIRRRDIRLQGGTNPAVAAYGTDSEAKQYGGRLVEPDWQCPFEVRSKGESDVPESKRIERQTGTALVLPKGATLRLIDPFGEQVCDVYAVQYGDPTHVLSSGRSLDYAERIWLTEGDILYSNRSVPMLRIGWDTVRRHDFLLTPCSQETFDLLYPDWDGYHPSCYENLCKALAPHGVTPDRIGTTFNAFMNVTVTPEGKLDIRPPLSQPGDLVELHAEMDLVVGLTACSAEMSNNGTLKPIDFEVL